MYRRRLLLCGYRGHFLEPVEGHCPAKYDKSCRYMVKKSTSPVVVGSPANTDSARDSENRVIELTSTKPTSTTNTMYWIDQEWRIFRNIKALETAGLELQQRRRPSLQQGCFRSIAGHISKSGIRESCVDIKRKNLHVVLCGCLHRPLVNIERSRLQ